MGKLAAMTARPARRRRLSQARNRRRTMRAAALGFKARLPRTAVIGVGSRSSSIESGASTTGAAFIVHESSRRRSNDRRAELTIEREVQSQDADARLAEEPELAVL